MKKIYFAHNSKKKKQKQIFMTLQLQLVERSLNVSLV